MATLLRKLHPGGLQQQQQAGSSTDAQPLLHGVQNSCSSAFTTEGTSAISSSDRSSSPSGTSSSSTENASTLTGRPSIDKSNPNKSRLKNVSGFDHPLPSALKSAAAESTFTAAGKSSICDLFWNSGLLCAAVSSIVFALSAFCVKLTHGRVPVLELCVVRSFLSFSMSLILMKGVKISPMFGHKENFPLLAARGCCGAMSMMLYYGSIQLLPLGDAVTVGLIQPPLTAVLARLVLKEPLGVRGAMGCVVSLAGVVFICQPPFLFGDKGAVSSAATSTRMFGALLGIGAAVLSSGSYIAIRMLGQAEKAPVVAMAFHTATLVLSCGPLAFGWPQHVMLPSGRDAGLLVGVAVTSFFGQLLMTRALQRTAAARVSGLSFTQVLYSYALSAIFFHQMIGPLSAFGVLLTLCGVALVVLRHAPRPPAQAAPASAVPLAPAGSLAEQVLKKQASIAGAAASANPSEEGQAPAREREREPPSRSYSRQRSLRALESFRRMSESIVGEGSPGAAAVAAAAAPLAAARSLLRQISHAASLQLEHAPSMSAADLALAAEGACSACTAALVASHAAYETFSQGVVSGGGAGTAAAATLAASAGVAEAVAAAFGGDGLRGRSGTDDSETASLIAVGKQERDEGGAHEGVVVEAGARGGGWGRGSERGAAGALGGTPRMSSRLSECLDGEGGSGGNGCGESRGGAFKF